MAQASSLKAGGYKLLCGNGIVFCGHGVVFAWIGDGRRWIAGRERVGERFVEHLFAHLVFAFGVDGAVFGIAAGLDLIGRIGGGGLFVTLFVHVGCLLGTRVRT